MKFHEGLHGLKGKTETPRRIKHTEESLFERQKACERVFSKNFLHL